MTILTQFSAATGGWFKQSFPFATPAPTKGWEAIQRGEHTLIHAPTGSGKTLAAYLSAIDELTNGSADAGPFVIGATDPAQPYGSTPPWPDLGDIRPQRRLGLAPAESSMGPALRDAGFAPGYRGWTLRPDRGHR